MHRMPNPKRIVVIPADDADDYAKPVMDDDEALEPGRYSGRQIQQQVAYQRMSKMFGKFDQGVGADGAHYVAKSPFGGEGLVCSNCAFYEGPRACEIVEGEIAPEAICKLWIIPEDLIKQKGSDKKKPQQQEPDDSKFTAITYEDGSLKKKAAPKNENVLPDRESAIRLARRLGCEGAHETEGGWAACPSPEALIATVRDGADGFKKWKASQGAGDGERERGIAGIETMPDGSLVSQKSAYIELELDKFYDRVDRRLDLLKRQEDY